MVFFFYSSLSSNTSPRKTRKKLNGQLQKRDPKKSGAARDKGEKNSSQRTAGENKEVTKTELEKFKGILEAKQVELSAAIRNRDDIAIEKAPDAIDEVQFASERWLAVRSLDRESTLLQQVRSALARIKNGSYGTCLHCEEDISPKRLNAVVTVKFLAPGFRILEF